MSWLHREDHIELVPEADRTIFRSNRQNFTQMSVVNLVTHSGRPWTQLLSPFQSNGEPQLPLRPTQPPAKVTSIIAEDYEFGDRKVKVGI